MNRIFTLFAFLITLQAAQAQLVITEIMYNPPGPEDYEYIEIYNNSGTPIDLAGYTITEVFDYTFPSFLLAAEDYIVVTNDSLAMLNAFGVTALQFNMGAINNSGEPVTLNDPNGNVIDLVEYSSSAPWPSAADGDGSSLVLCDVNSDNNDPSNWIAATTSSGFLVNGVEFLVNPGADSGCPEGAILEILGNDVTVDENAGFVEIDVKISFGNANATSVDLVVDGGTAINGEDYTVAPLTTITFPAGVATDTFTLTVLITDDMDMESPEFVSFALQNPTNQATIAANQDNFFINILDNDTQLTGSLIITGVVDAEPAGAGAKAIELRAIADIPDLSFFGVGSANNGDGSDGQEFDFPAVALADGECIYVAADSLLFVEYFGFDADFIDGAANINGDDAIEVFENGQVIDVFGDINADGSGEPWEYLDGWAYRKDGIDPNDGTFNVNNWTYSGVDALDGPATNDDADNPFPVCTYSADAPTDVDANNDSATTDQGVAITINVLANDILPNGLTTLTIITQPANGTAAVAGGDQITYTPNPDFCGDTDVFVYEVCDPVTCDQANVTVGVACPTVYTELTIEEATAKDADGGLLYGDLDLEVTGIVYGIDLQGGNPVQFTIIDETGGVGLFSGNDFGYTVEEGDEVTIRGGVEEFNCLTQLNPDTIILVSQDNDLDNPTFVTTLNESTESEFVQVEGFSGELDQFGNMPLELFDNGETVTLRFDSDTGIDGTQYENLALNVVGIGGQFNNQGDCSVGYQILPRYETDVTLTPGFSTFDESLATAIDFYPNPAGNQITVEADIDLTEIRLVNAFGQIVKAVDGNVTRIELDDLSTGIYWIQFQTEDAFWSSRLMKQ